MTGPTDSAADAPASLLGRSDLPDLVMLIDHDRLFSAALATLLEDKGLEVFPPFHDVQEAMRALRASTRPSLIIIDPSGFDTPPRQILQAIRDCATPIPLLVVSADLDEASVGDSVRVGAHGHVSKAASFSALLQAIRLIGMGQAVYPAIACHTLGKRVATTDHEGRDAEETARGDLSPREVQILACILSGYSNKAIARRLAITESTVKMHFKNAMRKIGAENRTQAAIWAMEQGIAPMA
jgi:two-component system, NarL family, nitrate/nitrite response regulator NarL